MAPPRSWALAHYHTEELSKGSALYLCCRICFHGKRRPSSEDLESSQRPGNQYPGCIRYRWKTGKSPAGLAAHLRKHDLEDPARAHHDQLSESLGEGGDEDTTWDFVRDMVVLDLADFASAERKGATRFYHKHLRLGNLAGRIQEAVGGAPAPRSSWGSALGAHLEGGAAARDRSRRSANLRGTLLTIK